ncbi:hypothetical protein KA977_01480 [Candidatus Dependentiae bacterium]|nr:hypothetical protein [Candidatus Dependentiae bacterium]
MKKKLYILFVIVLTLLSGINCSKQKETKLDSVNNLKYGLLHYLPEDSMIAVRCRNISETYADFIKSEFYRQLMSYPIVQTAKNGINSLDSTEFEKNFEFKPSFDNFIEIAGTDFAFAFTLKDNKPKYIILSEYTSDSVIKKIDSNLPKIFSNSENMTLSEIEIEGIKIKTVKMIIRGAGILSLNALDDKTEYHLNYFFDKGILCLSNDTELIKKSVETILGKNNRSIIDNNDFQTAFKQLDLNKQVITFFKPDDLSESLLSHPLLSNIKNAKDAFSLWNIISATSSSFDIKSKTVIKSYTIYNKNAKNQKLLEMYRKKSGELQTASFIPMNAMLFLTTNLIDASGMYDYYLGLFDENMNKKVKSEIKKIEKTVELDLKKDILNNIGSQISIALFDIDGISVNPNDALNSLAFIAEVKDKTKIDKLFQNSVKKYFSENSKSLNSGLSFKIEKSKYNENQITKIVSSKFKLNPPSYVFKDKFFIISSEKKIKDILDTPKEKSIINLQKISELKKILSDANGFFYFDFNQFITTVSEIADMTKVFWDRDDMYFSSYVKPILEVLTYIDCFSGYSKNDELGSLSELYIFTASPKNKTQLNSVEPKQHELKTQ